MKYGMYPVVHASLYLLQVPFGGNLCRSLDSTDFHWLHLSGWEPFRNGINQVCCEGI